MRKILIPTDFSENAFNAITFAIDLFKYEISEFYITNAYQDDIYADEALIEESDLQSVTETVSNNSKYQLNRILERIETISPNPKHSYHSVSANNLLIDEMDKIVDEKNIDIIVMGTRGKTNDKKITFGSHTLQVIKYVQCPVLAIPENYKYAQPKHILFPTNYLIPYKRRELKLLCEMASPFRAIIDTLYISISDKLSLRQKDNQTFIKEALHKNIINFKIIKSKQIINTIYQYIKENNIDMLVMVNTRHSFLEDILYQSTIDEFSLNIDIPFLALQNIKRY
ncbi:universal stress protein [Aestuariibaculum suncheonense]|uniref:Universal stress protein n=1 Tax=Aestuariibaculum suncheonense TaxID=1028745 RepID=A0A8J6QGT1_9FLAO|nr:universal stress protein [Aestuariibaculum suncheonense]MBD0835602.1 universal stress protein [Aestuariibaculum suncheonense]